MSVLNYYYYNFSSFFVLLSFQQSNNCVYIRPQTLLWLLVLQDGQQVNWGLPSESRRVRAAVSVLPLWEVTAILRLQHQPLQRNAGQLSLQMMTSFNQTYLDTDSVWRKIYNQLAEQSLQMIHSGSAHWGIRWAAIRSALNQRNRNSNSSRFQTKTFSKHQHFFVNTSYLFVALLERPWTAGW